MPLVCLNSQTGIPLKYANRHGLITGPTGTGKTVSLMTLAERFSAAGVPVFAPDVKGDLTALSRSCPAKLFDPFNGLQVPLWAMGPDLLARSLGLTDTQAGVLEIVFAHADRTGAPLDTLEHGRQLLAAVGADPESVSDLGHVTRASLGTIQRAFLRLEGEGAGKFFGPNRFDVESLMESGLVSILKADELLQSPRLYGAFLLYLLRDLQMRLPELGDMEKPRLVFIFDEAHTIFSDCPAHLLRAIESTARLIRSKGVGIYFASQTPADIPQIIREQCATRIEHARDLGVGKARFVTLNERGEPTAPKIVRPDLPRCPLGAAHMAPEAPKATQDPETAQGHDMTRAGHIFLAAFGLFIVAMVGGLFYITATGKLLSTGAVLLGGWLALRNKL